MKINPVVVGAILLVLSVLVGLAIWYFSNQNKDSSALVLDAEYKGSWILDSCRYVDIDNTAITIEGTGAIPYTVNSRGSISFPYNGIQTEIIFFTGTSTGNVYHGTTLVGNLTKGSKVAVCPPSRFGTTVPPSTQVPPAPSPVAPVISADYLGDWWYDCDRYRITSTAFYTNTNDSVTYTVISNNEIKVNMPLMNIRIKFISSSSAQIYINDFLSGSINRTPCTQSPSPAPSAGLGQNYTGLWMWGCKNINLDDSTIRIDNGAPVQYTTQSSNHISFPFEGNSIDIRFTSASGGDVHRGATFLDNVTRGPRIAMCPQSPSPAPV